MYGYGNPQGNKSLTVSLGPFPDPMADARPDVVCTPKEAGAVVINLQTRVKVMNKTTTGENDPAKNGNAGADTLNESFIERLPIL